MKRNRKAILAIIFAAVMITGVFAACTKNNEEAANVNNTENSVSDSVKDNETVNHTSKTESTTESTTEKTTENKTEPATKAQTTKVQNTSKPANKQTTTKKVNTTKKVTTTKKKAETTTKKKVATTKKVTTTKKQVKNVTPKEVQKQVNAYIRSKGITVDASMRPDNSGWSEAISGLQEDLNNGYSLKNCKSRVDREIKTFSTQGGLYSMYCYYDGNIGLFYILYT